MSVTWHFLQAFLCCCLVAKSCPTLCSPMNCSVPVPQWVPFLLLLLLSHLRITVKNMTLIKTVIDSFFFNLHLASNWTQCHFHLSSSVTGQMNISQFVTEIFKGRIQCNSLMLRNTICKYPLICIIRHSGLLTAICRVKLLFHCRFSNFRHYNFLDIKSFCVQSYLFRFSPKHLNNLIL